MNLSQSLETDEWINPVIRFYAGDLSEEAVLAAAADEDAEKDNEKRCEAYYYVGMARLLGIDDAVPTASDTAKAVEYFEKCLSTGVTVLESSYAEFELKRMGFRD